MQYALLDGFERKFLLDALEFGVLKDWKENPVKELPDIDDTRMDCHSIAYYDIHTLPLISCGHQKIVPFAALIKADECIISKISSYSGFAVTAFLRIKDQDIATNILNREGIFAFNGCERRFRHPVSEDNWQQAVSEERAIRCAKRLIQCKG